MKGRTKYLVMVVCVIGLVLSGCGGGNSDVALVKDGTMGGYETTTVGGAFDASFDNPQWEAFEADKGERVVQFTGTISQSTHNSVIAEVTDQLSALEGGGNPEQQMVQKEAKFQIQLNYLQAAVEKLGGADSAYFQNINKKFDCKLQFANLMGGVSAYIPDCKNDNSTAYMDAILNDFYSELWKVGTPVEVQWIINADGSGFSLSHMGSSAWEGIEFKNIVNAIYK